MAHAKIFFFNGPTKSFTPKCYAGKESSKPGGSVTLSSQLKCSHQCI